MSTDEYDGKRRCLDDDQIAEAFYKRGLGWSDEDVASFFGINLKEIQRSLGLPQFESVPSIDRSEGKR
jgi:hypothetical protein